MSLKHALLGFLNYEGMTGYELKQHFDQSVQHFWNANLSQIYPALSQMEKEGLLVMELEYQDNRPNRKVYKITENGRRELVRWLEEPMDLQPVREPFLIKIFFGVNLEREKILALLEHQKELHREQMDRYREIKESFSNKVPAEMKRDAVFWEMTLDAGIKLGASWQEWLEDSIKKIKV